MSTERSAAAVWRDGVMQALVAFDPSQPRDEQGQWTSDGSDQSASQNDEEAKALYAQLLNMPPEQRDAFLAGLNPDQLTRLGKFASTGKATDGPIADIRNKTGQAMAKRGLDPKAAGLKSKGGKKKAAGKKGGSKGGGSKGGGSKSGGGGGKKSSGGGSSKKAAPKKAAPKAEPRKTAPKAEAKPKPPPPPQLVTGPGVGGPRPVPGRRPGAPAPQPAAQGRRSEQGRKRRRPVRSSAGLTAAYNPSQPRLPHGGFGGGRWAGVGGNGGGGGGSKSRASTHADEITRSPNPKGAARELSRDELGAVDQEMTQRATALGKDGKVSKAHQAVKDEIARRDKAPTKPATPDKAPSSKAPAPAAPRAKPAPSQGKAHDKARDSVDDGDQDRLAGALEDAGVDDPEDAADQIMSMPGGKKAQKAAVDRLVQAARRPVRASAEGSTLAQWNAARYAARKAASRP